MSNIIHFKLKWQITKTRWFIFQIFFYYLIFSGARKVFHKIMQQLLFNEISRYIEIHGPKPPAPSAPILFDIRINTSGVNIRPVSKKSWYS